MFPPRLPMSPTPGVVLIGDIDGMLVWISGKPGQTLVVGPDGVPVLADAPTGLPKPGKQGQQLAVDSNGVAQWVDPFTLPKLPYQADVDPAPDTVIPAGVLPVSALLSAIVGRINDLVTDQAALRKALNAEIKRSNALAAALRKQGYMAPS